MGSDFEPLRSLDEQMIRCVSELSLAVQNLLGFVTKDLPTGPFPIHVRVTKDQIEKVERVLCRVRATYGIMP